MKQEIRKQEMFHRIFNQPVASKPMLLPREVHTLRYELMLEELNEYREACEMGDLVGVFDAIIDMQVILLGTAITHGMQDKLQQGFDIVFRNNIEKAFDEPFVALKHKDLYKEKNVNCEIFHNKKVNKYYLIRNDGKVLKPIKHPKPEIDKLIKGG